AIFKTISENRDNLLNQLKNTSRKGMESSATVQKDKEIISNHLESLTVCNKKIQQIANNTNLKIFELEQTKEKILLDYYFQIFKILKEHEKDFDGKINSNLFEMQSWGINKK